MTAAELEELLGGPVPKGWRVITCGERMLWRQADDTWVDYEEERREREQRRDSTSTITDQGRQARRG